ncbi:MAG: DUF1330 domain-containing protein, partial [Myxococcota bacterium]
MTESIRSDSFQAYRNRAEEGPVTMLNLLKFKPEGAALYAQYAAKVGPMLQKVGGHAVYAGKGAELLIGRDDEDWDMVLLITYPRRADLLRMIGSEEYQKIVHLRNDALARSVLLA